VQHYCGPDRVPKVRATLIARTALEWEDIFGDRVPCSATRSIEDMFDHPQVQAEDLVADFDHPLVARNTANARSAHNRAASVRYRKVDVFSVLTKRKVVEPLLPV